MYRPDSDFLIRCSLNIYCRITTHDPLAPWSAAEQLCNLVNGCGKSNKSFVHLEPVRAEIVADKHR